jgi:hypothetical protein
MGRPSEIAAKRHWALPREGGAEPSALILRSSVLNIAVDGLLLLRAPAS